MNEATANGSTRSLVPVGTMAVDADEVKRQASFYLEHARGGSPAFPRDLTPIQAGELARVAIAYGLDPMLQELIIYQGKLYCTIDGRIRKANEHQQYDGLECNPATDEERKAFRCSDEEHLWIARVWRKDRRVPFVGYGRASGAKDRNPVSRDYGQEMAQKRAKHRALRDAFSLPLPGAEEEGGLPGVIVEHAPRYVEPSTGEILEGEAVALEPPGPSRDQLAAIHIQAKSLGWTDEQYRFLLGDAFGVESSKELSEGQASALIESMAAIGENEAAEASLAEVRSKVDDLLGGRNAKDWLNVALSDDPPLPSARTAPPEPDPEPEASADPEDTSGPATDEQKERYRLMVEAGSRLGLDLAEFETDLSTLTRLRFRVLGTKLKQQIDAAERRAEGQGATL